MIGWLVAAAWAAPAWVETPVDPLQRCVESANAIAGIDGELAVEPLPSDQGRVAIVVGVPCHRSSSIQSLAFSTRDATRMADQLEASGYAVIRLTSVVDRAAFDAALDAADRALAPDGSLVVYFSGHGVLREEAGMLRRYLVFSDTRLDAIAQTAWPVRALDDRVSRMPASQRVVIQDTCFAADAEHGGKSVGWPTGAGRSKGLSPPEGSTALRAGDVRLYASRFFEQALESTEHRSSVYTHHLLEALGDSAADLDGDGCVGTVEAHRHAAEATQVERGGFQHPQMLDAGLSNITLGCVPAAPTHAVLAAPPSEDWAVELHGDDTVTRSSGAIEPGRYDLIVRRWTGQPNGEVALEQLLDTRVGLRAGTWLDAQHEVERRGPVGTIAPMMVWDPGGIMAPLGAGIEGWRATADRGHGRLAVGAVASWASGAKASHDQRLRFRGGTSEAQVGWWMNRPVASGRSHVAFGPTLAGGVVWRTPHNVDLPTEDLPTRAGWLLTPGVHGHVVLGPLWIGADGGFRVTGTSKDGVSHPHLSPSLRVSVGPRL